MAGKGMSECYSPDSMDVKRIGCLYVLVVLVRRPYIKAQESSFSTLILRALRN
jgi:hypothetical protein